MKRKSLKIAIYCCNFLFGEGIKHLIEGNGLDVDNAINCSNPEEIIRARPDLLIADFNTISTISIDDLFKHEVEILILWSYSDPEIEDQRLLDFISKGVVGILSPEIDSSQLSNAIKKTISGELWLDRKKLKDIISSMKDSKMKLETTLTIREKEVVKLICKGYRNKEIMKRMHICEQAVKKHLNSVYKKVEVTDRLQLAIHAIKYWSNYN